MKEIQTTAIVGMGALGMLYASQITEALGPEAAVFIADSDRVARYHDMTFTVNGAAKPFSIIDSRQAAPADLVIVSVKYNGLEAALDTMAGCVGPDTTIISVINGITSEEIIGARFGADRVLGCIAQGMDAVRFGKDLTYTQTGELRIGCFTPDQQPRLEALTRYLDRAKVPYTVEADIRYRLWGKFMLNTGVNQTCLAFETNYGGALTPGETYDTMTGAMREVMELAHLEGIPLTEEDFTSYIDLLRTLSPEGMPSMRQDGLAKRPSEVEMFSGTVIRMAGRHGLAVPVNTWLYDRIKTLEAAY